MIHEMIFLTKTSSSLSFSQFSEKADLFWLEIFTEIVLGVRQSTNSLDFVVLNAFIYSTVFKTVRQSSYIKTLVI